MPVPWPPRAARHVAPLTALLFLALQGADGTLAVAWGLLALGALASALCGMLDLQRPPSPIERGLLYVLLACAVSVVFGVDPRHSLALSVPTLASALLWILIARARDATRMFVCTGLGLAAAAAIQIGLLLYTASREPGMTPARWVADAGAAWLVVPNDVAWIACALPLFASLSTRRASAVLCVLLVAYLALSILVQSRTGALAAVGVALPVVAAWVGQRRQRPRGHWLIAVAVVAACGMLTLLTLASMRARIQLWSAAWAMFLDHPWTGAGLHDFVIGYRDYLPATAELVDPRLTPWPHQLFLEIAAECGVIGILAASYLVAAVLRRALACVSVGPPQRALVAGLCGMLLLALVEATLLRQWVWLLGTTLCGLLSLEDPAADQEEQQHEQRIALDETASRQHLRHARRR